MTFQPEREGSDAQQALQTFWQKQLSEVSHHMNESLFSFIKEE